MIYTIWLRRENNNLGKYGLKIKLIKAAPLDDYNRGVRDKFESTNAMFSKSLFYEYMQQIGMKSHKDESTRDIICIDFDFGTRSYEEELAHVMNMLAEAKADGSDEQRIKFFEDLKVKVEKNKFKYHKKTKDQLREQFYVEGVPVTYRSISKRTGEIKEETIHYRMLYRNPSKAKVGQCMFINEKLYDKAYDWLTMGLGKRMPEHNAKIVEMSAYMTLTTSSIIDTLQIPVEDILILKDQDSFFRTIADVVKTEDYETTERVIDEEKTARNKHNALKADKVDIHGDPIYPIAYKRIPCTKKKCVVVREETEVKNTLWDGMALIESDLLSHYPDAGMALLRNQFFKACAFRTRIQKFFQNWCVDNEIDYDTYEIKDMFGCKHLAKDVKIITTDNAIKWKKFVDLMWMGEEMNPPTLAEAYEYWKAKVRENGEITGIVKVDHPTKLDYIEESDVQQMSYQMVNTLPCSCDDVKSIAQISINYVEKLKNNNDAFETFLRRNATAVNHYEMLADLYAWNPQIAATKFFKVQKSEIIKRYIQRLRKGKITVPGDNLTVCGNPYALLLYTVGGDWEQDPTLHQDDGVVQCYAPRFEDGEFLCGIRNPHNSSSNIGYFRNVKHPLMDMYFDFSYNIMAVNCLHTDVQARMNGEDFDSDFNFVTNQPQMVEAARIAYRDYPTVVNDVPDSGITYDNTLHNYAAMDSKMQRAQRAIGGSSDSAQLAQSYYWTNRSDGKDLSDPETLELYNNIAILAVLAQLSIDGVKREYAVEPVVEIDRIRSLSCMNRLQSTTLPDGTTEVINKDYPLFMRYTHEIQIMNGKNVRPFEDIQHDRQKVIQRIDPKLVCPMNWLQMWLDKIQMGKYVPTVKINKIFINMPGRATNRQVSRIREIAKNYSIFLQTHVYDTEEDALKVAEKTQEVIKELQGIKIGNIITINRLIASVFSLERKTCSDKVYREFSRNSGVLLNLLYRMDRDKFLINFIAQE